MLPPRDAEYFAVGHLLHTLYVGKGSTALRTLVSIVAITSGLAVGFAWAQPKKTDAQIRQEMIAASIARYVSTAHRTCACPYSVDRAGRPCASRSAYVRRSSVSPLCYVSDVTPKMLDDYRKRTGQ